MILNGQKTSEMVSNDQKMIQSWPVVSGSNVPEWFGMVTKWFKMA
jgi:hypothetical protein